MIDVVVEPEKHTREKRKDSRISVWAMTRQSEEACPTDLVTLRPSIDFLEKMVDTSQNVRRIQEEIPENLDSYFAPVYHTHVYETT